MHYQTVIQDRTIYEDAFIFAKNLADSGLMETRDYQNYLMLYETITNAIKAPDIIVYLKADLPKLRRQIQKRGREFEQTISDEYLLNLNGLYENFADTYIDGTLLTIDVNDLDFENNSDDFNYIITEMNRTLGYR
jgi:deoxyadenosine/deoxycytidine kinase